MSNAVYPVLPGRKPGSSKTPSFATTVKRSASGRRSAIGSRFYPVYRFRITYDWLRASNPYQDQQTLLGFFLARRGRLDDFLYEDRDDHVVSTPQTLGVGDGSNKSFQLVRAFNGFVEPVYGVKTVTQVRVNSSTTAAYTVDSYGMLTLTTAPAAGQVVDWTGEFYFRVAFTHDEAELEEFLRTLWRGQVEFESSSP